MKRVGILYHPKRESAVTYSRELEAFLTARRIGVWRCSSWDENNIQAQTAGTNLIISVGGDGTILRSARAIAPRQIPIVGINLGKLGFLTELTADEALEKLPDILAGKGWVEKRALLETEVTGHTGKFIALNDVVVARGATARLITIEVTLDGKYLTAYRADGVIISTATGSTGYNLAAGGPILHPETKDVVLKPISPHFGFDQALVLPANTDVHLNVSTTHEAMVSIDGQVEFPLKTGDQVKARLAAACCRLLHIRPRSYFYNSLEQILKGKIL
jgi:NAD+ kinase